MHENIRALGAQYDQGLAYLCYEPDGVQAWLAAHEFRSEVSRQSLCFACERFKAYRSSSESMHLRLELYLSSGLVQFLTGVARFVNEAVDVQSTRVARLVSSASDALNWKPLIFNWGCTLI